MIFVLGPTASGKSALSMALAQRYPSEIISVDSALVFREMNIGSAKPSTADLAQVPHHLINLIDPSQSYSAAQFASDAAQAHRDITARNKLALFVGGTMLYVSALNQGFDNLPGANAQLRAQLDAQAKALGWPAMHARLIELDPISAARLQPTDSQRIQRALEVIELTGRTLSSQQTNGKIGIAGSNNAHLIISLEPSDRLALHARIEQRLKSMFGAGFIDEVRLLNARGDLTQDMPSMRCVGYRQIWQAIADAPNASNADIEKSSFESSLIATRQLCKRQLTWLRASQQRHVFDCLHNTEKLIDSVSRLIDNYIKK